MSVEQQELFKSYVKTLSDKETLNFKSTSNHVIIKYIHSTVHTYRSALKEHANEQEKLAGVMDDLCQEFLKMRHMTKFVLDLMEETIKYS